MTIPEYYRACAERVGEAPEALVARLAWSDSRGGAKVEALLSGEVEPTLHLLMKLEAESGLPLDAIDPRIKRGAELSAGLEDRCAAEGWPLRLAALTIASNEDAIRNMRRRGGMTGHARPSQAIAVCDLMEGRRRLMTDRERLQLQSEKGREKRAKRKARERAQYEGELMPVHGAWMTVADAARQLGVPRATLYTRIAAAGSLEKAFDYYSRKRGRKPEPADRERAEKLTRARRAFVRAVSPSWAQFEKRRDEDGTIRVTGDLLEYRIDVPDDPAKAVTIEARFRESGILLSVRRVG